MIEIGYDLKDKFPKSLRQSPLRLSERSLALRLGRSVHEKSRCSKGAVMKKRIIFVCVENSNRSQMAEAFAHIHGGDRVDGFSAGSRPSGRVNPKAIEAMKEVGYDLTRHDSKGLADFNGQPFDAAVTMGCGDECPLVLAKQRVDWQIPDPKELPPEKFREIRDLIESKVLDLISQLLSSEEDK
jgi:arsenate reductase